MNQKCTALTAKQEQCNAWAVHGSQPPRCSTHLKLTSGAGAPDDNQNRRTHGFYSSTYTLEELADLVSHALDDSLDDELSATRVAVRRVIEQLHAELPAEEYARLASLVFTGANTVARLLRTQRVLSGDSADSISGAIAVALDELASEWNIDL